VPGLAAWVTKKGKERPGRPWHKNHIYRMIRNPVYIGKVRYQDEVYEGEHDAIIDQDLWDMFVACGDGSEDAVLSGVGESCTKTADCESGLKCINQICQQTRADCPGDSDCSGVECGLDPVCGESCGFCDSDETCQSGQCVGTNSEDSVVIPGEDTVVPPGCENIECGISPQGAHCGTCSEEMYCSESGSCHIIGTWTDPNSSLTWQTKPTGGQVDWSDAKAHCPALGLADGGWHLPTISEFRSLIRGCPGTVTGGSCGVTDQCPDSSCNETGGCLDCIPNSGPEAGCYWPSEMEGECSWYWSLSSVDDHDHDAWYVTFPSGDINFTSDSDVGHVRCVR